jgi:hypothetical protein
VGDKMTNYKDKIQHPWQSGPTELIAHAIEHHHKGTESDNRIAFLLFDVGVETLFKTYLTLPDGVAQFQIKRSERLQAAEGNFHELLRAVQNSNPKKGSEFNFAHLEYYHELRNTLYHQGNRVTTVSTHQLEEYAGVAVKLLKEYLDIEVNEANEQELVQPNKFQGLARIRKNIASLEFNSSLMVEHLYPQIVTRKIDAQLRHIRTTTGPDDESYQPSVRAEFVQQRIDEFNKITGWDFKEDDYKFIENIIDHPERLAIWLAFEETDNDDWRTHWMQYCSMVDFVEREQYKGGKIDDKKYEEIDRWINEKAKGIYEWVRGHIPDVTPKEYILISLF